MEAWLNSVQGTLPEYNVGLSAIASARSSMKWGTDRADEILEAVGHGAAHTIVPTVTLLLSTLVALMLR